LTAKSLKDITSDDVENGNFQPLFGSAEDVLCKRILVAMKKQDTPLYENLAAVIVDEKKHAKG
jgi:hypothetical protein